MLVEKPFALNARRGPPGRRPRRRSRAARARGDVDEVPAAHGAHPRDHRRGHARRGALASSPTTPRSSPTTPRTASTRSSSAAARCSTSASTRSRSRGTCSARPTTVQAAATFKATGADAQIATIFGYDGDRMAIVDLGERHAGSEHRGRARQRGTHRDRPRLVHADVVPPRLDRRHRARGVHVRGERARHALPGGGARAPRRRRPARRRRRCSRPTRPSRSWARSTRSASRSGCATRASDIARPQIRVRTTAYNARVNDETDAPGDGPALGDPASGAAVSRKPGAGHPSSPSCAGTGSLSRSRLPRSSSRCRNRRRVRRGGRERRRERGRRRAERDPDPDSRAGARGAGRGGRRQPHPHLLGRRGRRRSAPREPAGAGREGVDRRSALRPRRHDPVAHRERHEGAHLGRGPLGARLELPRHDHRREGHRARLDRARRRRRRHPVAHAERRRDRLPGRGAPRRARRARCATRGPPTPRTRRSRSSSSTRATSAATSGSASWVAAERELGYMSNITALMVDGDRDDPDTNTSWRSDDPIGRAGQAFADELGGIAVIERGTAPAGAAQLGAVSSPTVAAARRQGARRLRQHRRRDARAPRRDRDRRRQHVRLAERGRPRGARAVRRRHHRHHDRRRLGALARQRRAAVVPHPPVHQDQRPRGEPRRTSSTRCRCRASAARSRTTTGSRATTRSPTAAVIGEDRLDRHRLHAVGRHPRRRRHDADVRDLRARRRHRRRQDGHRHAHHGRSTAAATTSRTSDRRRGECSRASGCRTPTSWRSPAASSRSTPRTRRSCRAAAGERELAEVIGGVARRTRLRRAPRRRRPARPSVLARRRGHRRWAHAAAGRAPRHRRRVGIGRRRRIRVGARASPAPRSATTASSAVAPTTWRAGSPPR